MVSDIRYISRVFILSLILLCGVCHSVKSFASELLVGFWVVQTPVNCELSYEEFYSFFEDGKFTIDINKTENNKTDNYKISGIYTVDKDTLHYEALESNHPNVLPGKKDWNKILVLTENLAITQDKEGKVTVSHRIGDPRQIKSIDHTINLSPEK